MFFRIFLHFLSVFSKYSPSSSYENVNLSSLNSTAPYKQKIILSLYKLTSFRYVRYHSDTHFLLLNNIWKTRHKKVGFSSLTWIYQTQHNCRVYFYSLKKSPLYRKKNQLEKKGIIFSEESRFDEKIHHFSHFCYDVYNKFSP